MELRRRTWIAALKLAVVISIAAAILAAVISSAGSVNEIAIVLPVIVIAFVASWVQSGRVQRSTVTEPSVRVPAATV
ncbi:MAG: hypothetical protein ACR2O6_07970 [Ilumatobacteraceae bacterium]